MKENIGIGGSRAVYALLSDGSHFSIELRYAEIVKTADGTEIIPPKTVVPWLVIIEPNMGRHEVQLSSYQWPDDFVKIRAVLEEAEFIMPQLLLELTGKQHEYEQEQEARPSAGDSGSAQD